MSMTYYAVTDDPNELAHFGILGMKWGVRRSPEQLGHPRHSGSRRPRSSAYKKAQSKLGKMMKSGIKKAEANWKAYNSPEAKEARFMKKAMQKARNGTLKYGKLTDEQVRRVTDRLALERNARMLGNTENPSYARRIKTALGEGVVRGIGAGTASYIDERFRGRGRTTAEIKSEKRKAKYEASRAGQRAARRRAKNEVNEEFYKTSYEEGMNPLDRRFMTSNERARYLSEVKERDRLSSIKKSQQDAFDKAYYANAGKHKADWDASNARKAPSGWNTQKPNLRLTSGNSNNYPVTKNTYNPPKSNEVIYVDSKGNARWGKRSGRKKYRVNYD